MKQNQYPSTVTRHNKRARVRKAVASAAAVLSLTACDVWNEDWEAAIEKQQIDRCHGSTVAAPVQPVIRPDKPLVIHKAKKGSAPEKQSKAVQQRIAAATMNIYNNNKHVALGVSVVGRDAAGGEGERVIVTSARAIMKSDTETHDMQHLSVQDYNGNESKVKGACILYAQGTPPSANSIANVAVLRLEDNSLGNSKAILSIAGSQQALQRGKTVWFYSPPRNDPDHQPPHDPHQPAAAFTGRTLLENPPYFLTGIQDKRSCQPDTNSISPCAFTSGRVGAPITDVSGYLLAIATSPDTNGEAYMYPDVLANRYNTRLTLPTGEGTGNWPVGVSGTPAHVIRHAVESTAY